MRLFLIRHGETVDNVAGNYAGITDSALTNHGVLQAYRLGAHLATTEVEVKHIFSSDLQRAFDTAEAVRKAQATSPLSTTKLELLREQDFGFYEGKQFFERPREGNKSGKDAHSEAHRNDPGFRDVESKDSMRLRMENFVDAHLIHLIQTVENMHAVVVVAHGIILNHLWRTILKRFPPGNVGLLPGIQAADRGFSLEYLGGWSNTGYLELEIKRKEFRPKDVPSSAPPNLDGVATPSGTSAAHASASSSEVVIAPADPDGSTSVDVPPKTAIPPATVDTLPEKSTMLNMSLLIRAVNCQEHLKGLKKTRGGIGNLKHDSKQKTVDSFFKKRRLE